MRFNDVGVLVETAIFSHVAASFTWLAAAFLFHKSATAALCSASTSLQRKFARQVARTMLRYIGAVARFPRVAMYSSIVKTRIPKRSAKGDFKSTVGFGWLCFFVAPYRKL